MKHQKKPLSSVTPGILLVDKPSGITSHDVVDLVRKKFSTKKVGHGGTLDPLASGVLVVLIGREATKLSDSLRGSSKKYEIGFTLGFTTNELDTDGEITEQWDTQDPRLHITPERFTQVVSSFKGSYEQEVPAFSAVKVGGKKLYELARNNPDKLQEISIPVRTVTIFDIELTEYVLSNTSYPHGSITTTVSGGTYTRALLRDIGKILGVPIVQNSLRRIQAGDFTIQQTKPLEMLSESDIIPISEALSSSQVQDARFSS